MPRARQTIRIIFLATLALTTVALVVPTLHLARTWWRDSYSLPQPERGVADDASYLNATRVGAVIEIDADDGVALQQIRAAYQRAEAEKLGVSIAGVRHSMGGQTMVPDGIVLNMLAHDHTHYDHSTHDITVGAGATWDLVIPYLDRFGRSVEVMQSDSPFSVGGSLSVNAHGWQPGRPPIASTVRSFTLVTPDGKVKLCSESTNRGLFRAALGGYGMFGVILDVTLRTVPNETYRWEEVRTSVTAFEDDYRRIVDSGNDVGLAYGRVSVAPGGFLESARLNVYRRLPGEPEPLEWTRTSKLRRLLFRGSVRSSFGKRLRWWSEQHLSRLAHRGKVTRNHLMDGDTELYTNRSAAERDILHEYFIPRRQLSAFLAEARTIIPRHRAELLNVTLRDVKRDTVTLLPYAREDVMGVVMFFSQRPTSEDDARMREVTRALIDAALKRGGTYYLPYRLHATPQQFRRAYPQCGDFFALKQRTDPEGLLRSRWYDYYAPACR